LDGIEGTLRGLVAALGLNSLSRIAWERFPFSFVVDWLVNTKGIAESLTVQPFTGGWDVYNVSHSFKQKAEWSAVATGFSLAPYKNMDWGELVVERYVRGSGLPVSASIFDGEMSTAQLVLSAALLGAASK
jgi:hypothetical protein